MLHKQIGKLFCSWSVLSPKAVSKKTISLCTLGLLGRTIVLLFFFSPSLVTFLPSVCWLSITDWSSSLLKYVLKRHWYLHYLNIQWFFTAIQVSLWLYLLPGAIPRNCCLSYQMELSLKLAGASLKTSKIRQVHHNMQLCSGTLCPRRSWHGFNRKLDKFMEEESTEKKPPHYCIILSGSGSPQPANCWLGKCSQRASLLASLPSHPSADTDLYGTVKRQDAVVATQPLLQ